VVPNSGHMLSVLTQMRGKTDKLIDTITKSVVAKYTREIFNSEL